MKIKYKGDTHTFKAGNLDPLKNIIIDKELVHDTFYDIDIVQEGPIYNLNGQTVVPPETDMWIVFNDCRIPYSAENLFKQWKV